MKESNEAPQSLLERVSEIAEGTLMWMLILGLSSVWLTFCIVTALRYMKVLP